MEVITSWNDRPLEYQGFSSAAISVHGAASWVRPISMGPIENLFYKYNREIETFPASVANHQWWTGGWRDHLAQMLHVGWANMKAVGLTDIVSREQFYIMVLLHDLEKLRRYHHLGDLGGKISTKNLGGKLIEITPCWAYNTEYFGQIRSIQEDLESIQMAAELGFPLDTWLLNGIAFAAGGFSLFAKTMTPLPLSAILHAADFISAHNLAYKGDNYE